MAQVSDFTIANASGSAVRTDLNNVFAAIQSTNIGSSAPSGLAAGQIWIDNSATPWVLKVYDGSDHITVGTINASTNAFNLAVAQGGTGAATAAAAATALGLGTGDSPNFTSLSIGSEKFQSFAVKIVNSSGTLQHQIFSEWGQVGGVGKSDKITGASTTLANTPSVDASTNFTNGVGVNGSSIVFNTGALSSATFAGTVTTDMNQTGTAFIASPTVSSRNVNGTTRLRLEFALYTLAGGTFNINTTNIASTKYIICRFFGYLP